ncbi:MAG: CoA-binding protein [SAR202 cluster bacterium]|nr:CoA-binding protein [SAR202 cluster bacterium]
MECGKRCLVVSIERLLRNARVIAVVGLSDRPERASHDVARYLQSQGYRVIPVNPHLTGPVLGEQPYPDLRSVPVSVDVVDIFRKAEDVPPVVEEAIATGAGEVWMQLGIVNEAAAAKARDAGVDVVMDKCMRVEHRELVRQGKLPGKG